MIKLMLSYESKYYPIKWFIYDNVIWQEFISKDIIQASVGVLLFDRLLICKSLKNIHEAIRHTDAVVLKENWRF